MPPNQCPTLGQSRLGSPPNTLPSASCCRAISITVVRNNPLLDNCHSYTSRGQILRMISAIHSPRLIICSSSHTSGASSSNFLLMKRLSDCLMASRLRCQGPFFIEEFKLLLTNVRLPSVWINLFRLSVASSSSSGPNCQCSFSHDWGMRCSICTFRDTVGFGADSGIRYFSIAWSTIFCAYDGKRLSRTADLTSLSDGQTVPLSL